MTHIDRLSKAGHLLKPDTTVSIPVARDHGYYAGILYPYLQKKQGEQDGYSEKYNVRLGIRWIPKLSFGEILNDLPVFPSTKAISRAAEALRCAGLILMNSTGEFLKPGHRTNRKRDLSTWWHVSQQHAMSYADRDQWFEFSALEAAAYSVAQALILSWWRHSALALEEDGYKYRKLSAVELEKVLPMDDRTARRHLKSVIEAGILVQHPEKPKLYRLGGFVARSRPVEDLEMAA